MNLLVVEDDPQLRQLMGTALHRAGYEVAAVPDAESALELYDQELAGPHGFDLVLLDLTLPAMSGCECLQHLVRPERSAKVIITSGMPREARELESQGLDSALDYLPKPFTLTHLMESVEKVLDAPGR